LAMGTRELQKNAKRRSILDAARMLIQEGKSKDFSMLELAKKAGVSPVTPYNLFGTKSNILLEITRDGLLKRTAEIEVLPTDDLLEWVSEASRTLALAYYRGRHLFRSLIVALTSQESAEGLCEINRLTAGMYEGSIVRLQTARELQRSVSSMTIALTLSRGVTGSMQHCLLERGTEKQLWREIELAILMVIAGWARNSVRERICKRVEQLDKEKNRFQTKPKI